MSKSDELISHVQKVAKDTAAFAVVHLDSNGQCRIIHNGDPLQACFMVNSLQSYVMKTMMFGPTGQPNQNEEIN